MSVELPRQPTGAGQACYKCGSYFVHTRGNPRGRQCGHCRNVGKKKNRPAVPRAAPVRVAPGHPQAWDSRALGQSAAAALAQAGAHPGAVSLRITE